MQVLYPDDMQRRRQTRLRLQKRRKRKQLGVRLVSLLVTIAVLVAGGGLFSFTRPIAAVEPSLLAIPTKSVAPLSLPWPRQGQAAVGAGGYGVLDEHNTSTPRPTASTAKIFTALMIMKAKPLQPGQQGPLIPITAADEAIYHAYLAKGGSVYPVTAGEQISQYEALRALLLPSANNIADLLVRWAYGSMQTYTTEANQHFRSTGLTATTITDASGFAQQTVSTAHDLTLAGELLLNDPVLSEIVAKSQVTVPGIGVVHSTNLLLAKDNHVVGIKTGRTDEAGGCFVIAVKHAINASKTITLVSAVMGASDVSEAMNTARRIVHDAKLGFSEEILVAEGQTLARYHPGWGSPIEARAAKSLKGVVWLPSPPEVRSELAAVGTGSAGSVGMAKAIIGSQTVSVPIVLSAAVPYPSMSWRLYKRYT